jgi:hypothetical protein
MYPTSNYLTHKDTYHYPNLKNSQYYNKIQHQLPSAAYLSKPNHLHEHYNPLYSSHLLSTSQLNHHSFSSLSSHDTKHLKNKNLNHPGYKKRPAHDIYE